MTEEPAILNNYTGYNLAACESRLEDAATHLNQCTLKYKRSIEKGNAITENDDLKQLQVANIIYNDIMETYNCIKSKIDTEPENTVYSKWTGEDLADLDSMIKDAILVYNEKNKRYLESPHASWAKRNLLPGVNQAKSYLDSLTKQKEAMLSDMGKKQGIELVDSTAEAAITEPKTEIPWKIIGLAVGAIVVIVIVVKVV